MIFHFISRLSLSPSPGLGFLMDFAGTDRDFCWRFFFSGRKSNGNEKLLIKYLSENIMYLMVSWFDVDEAWAREKSWAGEKSEHDFGWIIHKETRNSKLILSTSKWCLHYELS